MRYHKLFVTCGILIIVSVTILWISGFQKQNQASSNPAIPFPESEPSPLGMVHNDFYMVIFASQRDSNEVRYSHSFAAFVRATGKAKNSEDDQVAIHTLSWLPRSLNVAVLRPRPEPGVNLDLQATLEWAASVQARVTAWGPYRIDEKLYQAARKQIDRLNSGSLQYKAVNLTNRSDAINCIYALADIEQERGQLSAGTAHGEAASLMVLRHLQHRILDANQTHEWVKDRLGLKNHAVTFKTLP